MLKVAYFGTPDFSANFLEKLLNDKDLPIEIVLVVTQPDKLVGRKQIMTPTPVKVVAEKYHIDVKTGVENQGLPQARSLQDDRALAGKDSKQAPSILKGFDLAILFAYGAIIPQSLLDQPRLGFWNIHPSLLPKYRGASPIVFPILNGDKQTGVTLMQMDAELDHGPIIAQDTYEIQPDDKAVDLEKKLSDLAFKILKRILIEVKFPLSNDLRRAQSDVISDEQAHGAEKRGNEFHVRAQNHSDATYTRRLTKQDGFIPLEKINSVDLYRLFRAYYPWPGIWTKVMINDREMRLKITDINSHGIQKVQLEGKNEVDLQTFKKAYPQALNIKT